MPVINYYGTPNYNEYPLTGVQRLWTTGMKQDVPDAVASKLLAVSGSFQLEADGRGEPITYTSDPVTGGIRTSVAGQNLPETSQIGLSSKLKLRRSLAKLARAYSNQMSIGVLGHSVVAGAYANDAGVIADGTWNTAGWVAVMRKFFASQFGTASVAGMLHPAENFATNYTVAAGAAQNGPNNSVGVGGYRIDLAAAANTVSVTGTGRYLRVWGFAATAGVKARYTIDGGALTTDPGAGSAGATPNGQYWYSFDIDCGTDAAHTVVLQGAASGSWYLYSHAFLSQTTSGVLVHRMGWSGKVLPDLLALSLDGTDTAGPAWRTTLTANGKTQQLQSITSRLSLDLIVIMVDVNDLTGGWTTYGYSLADIYRHAQNAVNAITGQGVDVLFVTGPWRDPSSYGAGVPFTQADVIAQYAAVADANDRVAHVDLTKGWASYAVANTDGFYQDVVHPSSIGHAWMGKQVFNALIAS